MLKQVESFNLALQTIFQVPTTSPILYGDVSKNQEMQHFFSMVIVKMQTNEGLFVWS